MPTTRLQTRTTNADAYLILIKHAMPEIDRTISSHLWRLSDDGRRTCETLARLVAPYFPTAIVTSIEPKAVETGEVVSRMLQIPLRQVLGLQENDRSDFAYLDQPEYEATFRRFFNAPDARIVGRETARQAGDRFGVAIDEVLTAYPQQTVAVVTHGTVMSLFIQRVTGQDPFPFWSRIGWPSFVLFRRPDLTIERIVERVR